MASHFCLFLSIVLFSKCVVGGDFLKSSLTFVIDDTFSMSNDIDQVKLGANAIFDTVLRHNASQIENFLLVTFNDYGHGNPGVIFRVKTKDREEFKKALSDIDVNGGGDCPEYALSGIKKALEESLDRSYLYIFTDATAKDYKDFEEVKAMAQKKQSQIVFVLTGNCYASETAPAYQVYHEIAQATSGEVFHLTKTEVGKILEYVKKTITGRRTTLAVERLPPGKHNMTFYVDMIMAELTLSTASKKSDDRSVTITAPDGSAVWKTILFETDQVQVYSIDVTMPGAHTVEVNSKTETRAVVSARSGVDFQHGFSAYKLSSMVDTSTRPAPGTKSHLSIKLNEGDILLQTVQILDMDDNVKLELPLVISNEKTKLYSTPAFDPPNTMFKIVIIGYDPKSKSKITRTAATPVEPQKLISGKKLDNRSPKVNIEGEAIVNAKYDKPLQLVCKVNGFPEPTIVWRNKDKDTVILGEVSILELPYDYMSVLNIEKVQENVTYECDASNSAGNDTKQTTVTTVISKKFNVVDTPKRIQIEYNEEGKISCKVDASPADITWYKRGVKLVSNENIEISSDKSVVTIKHAKPSDKGRYMCEARNKDKRKLIFKYVAITGIESPEIDKEVHDVSVKKDSSVVIACKILKGKPKPTILWYHANDGNSFGMDEIVEWKDKESIVVNIGTKLDTGSYLCEAKNDVGTDYHETTLHLKYLPTIETGVKLINAAIGSKLSIPCHADGGPPPNVTWYKDDVEITNSHDVYIFGNQTLRIVAQLSDSGRYTCKATNELGSVNKTVKVVVNVPVNIKLPSETNMSPLVGSSLTLPCEASGNPKPSIEWIYHSFNKPPLTKTIRPTAERMLLLNHIQESEEGFYTCVANNTGGSMNITFEVHVLVPPSIKNTYPYKLFEVVEGDLALRIPCVVSGNPRPTSTWTKDGLNLAIGNTYYIEEGTLIIINVPKDASGPYKCEASSILGSAQEIYEVIVLDYPPPQHPTSSIFVEQGMSVDITCDALHKDIDDLRWYKNGVLIRNGKLTLTNSKVSDSGLYTCRVGDFFKSVSSTTNVIVGSKPEFTTSEEDVIDIEIMEGLPISLNCENRGEPKPEVEWYLNDKKLNETEPEYHFIENIMHQGQYKCIVKNALGSITKTFNVTPRDCFVDTNKLTKLHPLMMTASLEWPIFEKSDGYLVFLKGEHFILFCPTRFKMFPKQHITAFCDGGMNILINGEKFNYGDIQCTEEVKHTVKRTGMKCMPGDTETISVGYDIIDAENPEVYEICLNKTSQTPIYAKNILQSSVADDEYKATWSDSDQFLMNLEEVYNCKKQINTISVHLGKWFHIEDECCFTKRQLVSPRDVFPGVPQKSTFSYLNVVPQWSNCNAENWNEIEQRVRNYAKNLFSELIVWTGTSKELSLKSFRGTTSSFFADEKGYQQPVPMFLWKVIQDPASMLSLAIIQINVPDLRTDEVSEYVLCKDLCGSIDWMKNSDWHDVKKGYTYCCRLDEFENAFGFRGTFEPNMMSVLTSDAFVLPETSLAVI